MTEHDPLQKLWSRQNQEPFQMSLADIHTRATRFQSTIRWRNAREYIAGAFVFSFFAWVAATDDNTLVCVGAVLIATASAFVNWNIYRRGRAAPKAALDMARNFFDFHRAELVRQRDTLRTVWRWYLGPYVPGLLIFLAGASFGDPDVPLGMELAKFALGAGIGGAVFASIGWVNAEVAKRMDGEIGALDARLDG